MFYYKELSKKILGSAFEVYNILGNGFLEKIYENSMLVELDKKNLHFNNQKALDVRYKDEIVGSYYADIVVEDKIILELKTCNSIIPEHRAQILNYLKATGYKVGYLLNFGHKDKLEYERYVF